MAFGCTPVLGETNWAKVCLNQQPHDGNIQNDVRMDLLGKISDRDRVVPFAQRFPFFVTSRLERRSCNSLLTQLARFTPRLKSGFSEAAIENLNRPTGDPIHSFENSEFPDSSVIRKLSYLTSRNKRIKLLNQS